MKTAIDTKLSCCHSCTLRVLHEDHGTHSRNDPSSEAIKRLVGCVAISAPIIGVDNEEAVNLARFVTLLVHAMALLSALSRSPM